MDLIKWLDKQGLTPYKFARTIEIPPSILYEFIRGERKITSDMAEHLSKKTNGEVPREEFIWPTFKPLKKKAVGRPKKIKK